MSPDRSIEERWWQEQKKKQEGKQKVADMRREFLDEYSAFVWSRQKPMPSAIISRKHRALSLGREFASRGFKKGAQMCRDRVSELDEAIQSGFAAVPMVMVDEENGAYEVLMKSMGMPPGYGLDDYPTAKETAKGDGAKE